MVLYSDFIGSLLLLGVLSTLSPHSFGAHISWHGCFFVTAVVRQILQLLEQTKAAALETKLEVHQVFQLMSSGGRHSNFNDFSDAVASVKQMDSLQELLDFCDKLHADRNFRKQVVCTISSTFNAGIFVRV